MSDNCTICPFVQYWYVFVALIVVLWAGMKFFQSRPASPLAAADAPGVLHLDQTNFQSETAQGAVLVDFWASWCGPCRRQGTIINEVAESLPEGVKIAKVNVDEAKDLARQYEISGIPAWVIFQNGELMERLTGLQSPEQLLALAAKYQPETETETETPSPTNKNQN